MRVVEKGSEVIYAMSWLAGTVIMKEALFDQVGNLIQLAKYCPFPFTRNNILVHGRSFKPLKQHESSLIAQMVAVYLQSLASSADL